MKPTRFVFLSACLGMMLFGASFITLGSIAPSLQQKFDMSELEAGTLFSILPFGILAGSLIFGPVADRYGYKAELVVAGLLMAAGFLGISSAGDPLMLKGCILIFGLSGGVINGACNAAVADISVAKGANLSIIGVFYAVGALGMPVIVAALHNFSFEKIVSGFGYFALAVTIVFMIAHFPPAKFGGGIPAARIRQLLAQPLLLLVGFFLFCQSSFEAIVNNWTTTFLIRQNKLNPLNALYVLSLYVIGMAAMRVLLGGVFRKFPAARILAISFVLLAAGVAGLQFTSSFIMAAISLFIIGAGLAAGFPVMLGIVGERYADLSGTAFSIVIVIALIGNMLLNVLMGVIAEALGIQHLITLFAALITIMAILTQRIIKKTNHKSYAVETMAQ
ncbi:MAG TPA: MFS transporter [Chryseolinea sp.]|nr:MFS transporter [Chryseolinea sp.]